MPASQVTTRLASTHRRWVRTSVFGVFAAIVAASGVIPTEALAQLQRPASGVVAYHSYTQYGIDPSDPNGPNSLDGRIRFYDFATDSVTSAPTIDATVRHAINPNFSTDGSRIAFMGLPKGDYGASWAQSLDLYVYDLRQGTLLNLSQAAALGNSIDEDAVFGPQNNSVVFKLNRQSLWSIDLHDYHASQLVGSSTELSGPRVSPDGSSLAYWIGDGATADVLRRNFLPTGAAGPATFVAATPQVQEYFPSFIDSARIAYTRWPDPTTTSDDLYVYDIASGTSAAVPFNSAADDSDAFGLSGGQTIGFSSTRPGGEGGYDLYLGDLGTGQVTRLREASTPKQDLGASFAPQTVRLQRGAQLLDQPFDTDAADSSALAETYGPTLRTILTNTSVDVTGGRLTLKATSGFGEGVVSSQYVYSTEGGLTLTAEIGANESDGDFNVGLVINDTSVVFHPGYASTPGAFRIGNGANRDMGFVPANGVLHHWRADISPNGEVVVSVTDGENPNNVYTATYTDPSLVGGMHLSVIREGGVGPGAGEGWFDDIRVARASTGIAGDFNGDFTVDQQDYQTWASMYGEAVVPLTGADGNGDGVVDAADFTLWRDAVRAGSPQVAVPEPSSTLKLMVGAFAAHVASSGRQAHVRIDPNER